MTRCLVLHPHLKTRAAATRLRDGGRTPERALEEAVGLAAAIDLEVAAAQVVTLPRAHPGALFGSGKVDELKTLIADEEVGLVVIDTTLPAARLAKMPHHALLTLVAAADPDFFEPVATYPLWRADERFDHGILVYRFHPPPASVTKE